MLILVFMLVGAGSQKSLDVTPAIRKIQLTEEKRTILVHTAPNAVTSLRFNRSLDKDKIVCGDNKNFIVEQRGDNQLNVKAATDDVHASTNCNLYTTNGIPVLLVLNVTDKMRADAFIEAEFTGAESANLTDAEFNSRYQRIIDDRVFAAVEECKNKSTQSLAAQAADAIISRRLNERAVVGDVILAIHDIVKIGSRGIIRFSIDNQSRDQWAAGTVKLMFVASGQEPLAVDAISFFKHPSADRGEEIFGAVTFDMYQVPDTAKFTIQVLERNGSRNPQVSGVRL